MGKRSPVGEEIQRRENLGMFKSHMMRGGDSEQERVEEGRTGLCDINVFLLNCSYLVANMVVRS